MSDVYQMEMYFRVPYYLPGAGKHFAYKATKIVFECMVDCSLYIIAIDKFNAKDT